MVIILKRKKKKKRKYVKLLSDKLKVKSKGFITITWNILEIKEKLKNDSDPAKQKSVFSK